MPPKDFWITKNFSLNYANAKFNYLPYTVQLICNDSIKIIYVSIEKSYTKQLEVWIASDHQIGQVGRRLI